MKKIISLFLSLVMLLSITAGLNLTASAGKEDVALTYGDYKYIINDDNTVNITEYTGSATNLDILSTIDGKSVTSIGSYAFSHCTSLSSIRIPDSVTSIGWHAFEQCTSLTSLTIPNSVTSIGDDAFYNCTSLTSITIGNSVTSIGDYAFDNCTSLTSINVGEGNTNYSSQDGVLFNKDKTELIRYPIGDTRTSYIIPNSVTSIDSWAFEGCTSLTSINVEEGNANYSSQDGVLFNKDKTELIQYPIGNTRTSYIIPNSVTSIGVCAFFECKDLTDVYYDGTKSQWNDIVIKEGNYLLENATIHCSDGIISEPSVDPIPMPNPTPTPEPAPTPSSEPTTQPSTPATQPTQAPTTVAPAPVEPTTVAPVQTTQVTAKSTTKAAAKETAKKTTKAKEVVNKKQKKAKLKKATGSKKAITLTWAKVKGVNGYQIQVATDKKFKKNKKTVTIKKQKTTKTTVKKLKAKKTYYVRIRTYKTKKVNGKSTKVYSSWSKAKTVKTK